MGSCGTACEPRISRCRRDCIATSLCGPHDSCVEFRILGPLEVLEDGRALAIGSRKRRELLSLLLLHAGEVVQRDRLIDDLWHGDPPPAAASTLRAHVSRLRVALGATRL